MAAITVTVRDVNAQRGDIATRLLNGTLHAEYPDIDEFITLDRLLKSHASRPDEAQRPLVCFPVRGPDDFEEHTAGDLDRHTDSAVRYYMQQGLPPADPDLEQAPVVALLAGSSFEAVLTFFALNRLGYAVLFLSTRLTAPALSRLMAMVNSDQLINSSPYQRTTLANFRKSFGLRLFTISPLFHSQALMELGRAMYTRAPSYLGNHSLPVTYQNLLDALKASKPEQFTAVPYVINLLAEKPEGVQALVRPKIVLYGGSSCPDDLGDRLVAQGVNLVGNYGATETGQIMTSFRPPGDTEWQYMRLHRPMAEQTLMDEISPGVFECVALDGMPSKGPSNSKPPYSARNPENSFRTADLFTRHPDPKKSNYYKYLSRLDDRITLVNGEKVLPIAIEGRIREDPLVGECVVFGFQRSAPGALIFRAPDNAPELSDEEFLEAIWPSVEVANSRAETFSRIPKELTVVKGADVAYARTDKGTFIRAQVYQQFAEDIEQVYAKFESSQQGQGTLALSVPDLEDWLLSKFRDGLGVPLTSAESDIFSAGVDSLQTMQMWRYIVRGLDLGEHSNQVSQNIVFEKGTVRALAKYLYQLRTGQEFEEEDELQVMQELIEKYSHFTQHYSTITQSSEKEVVVVTGATGNLGAFIVAKLLKKPTVSEVWTFIRAPGQAAAGARLYKALADRSIVLTDDEAAKLHAVPSDLSQPNLGLETHVIQHLLSSLTAIIHSAWAVNFNLGVRSFEQQHIRGTYNLINFCLRSNLPTPARFFFCSSVSTASGTPKPASIPEQMIENLEHAQGMGYGRSKLVTEHITRHAMRQTGMHARVLRIGQLAGDTVSAQWNDTEAVALMFRSALTTNALPELDERVSWLPVDQCGQVVADISMNATSASSDVDLVYHLVNPHMFSWKHDLLPALKKGSALPEFDIVSPPEWLERLASSDQNPEKNPSIKLIDFWRSKYASYDNKKNSTVSGHKNEEPKKQEPASGLVFSTQRTTQDCPSLALVENPVNQGLIQRHKLENTIPHSRPEAALESKAGWTRFRQPRARRGSRDAMAEHDHLPRESIDSSIHQVSDLVPADGSSFRPANAGQQPTNPNVFSDDYSIDSPDTPFFSHRRSLSLRSTNSSSTVGPRRSDGSAAASDHNMQLMLSEQQNKRRLLMARQQPGQSSSRLSLTQSHASTPGDEITADPFSDQPTSSQSQNDIDRRSSIRKDVAAFHRQSTLSTTSTRSAYHDFPREMSPYQGATGPSHPYAMYPQIGVSRSASVATASTTRPDAPLRGPTAPSHPYGMYPQNIDYEEDLGDRPIPMGFPTNGMQNSQESTHADEVGDIVGPDGHLEQLPPYSRYPDGIVRSRAGRGPASIASAMREPRQSYHDEPVSRSDVSSHTLVNADSSEPLRPSVDRSSRSSTVIPFDEKLRQKGQRKCCGAPLWLLALLGLGMLIGGLIGGVIGGVLGERAAERRSREAAAARHSATAISPPPPSPAVVTITETTDVSPYSVTPTGIPSLPTGKYQIPWTVKNTSKFCIGSSNELQAWSCHVFDPLAIEVMGSLEHGTMSIESPSFDNSHFSYGAQLPYDISPPQQELRMMKDKDDVNFGPALYFTTLFNKLVIVEEQQISMSKRSIDDNFIGNGWNQKSNNASPGDKPWYCWWNQTQIEIFIYVNETQGESTTSTAPQSTTTSEPQKRSLYERENVIPGKYPRKTKVKENRVIPNAPQAYCQQMQINPDNSITPIPNNVVKIDESKSNSGSPKRDSIYARGDYQSRTTAATAGLRSSNPARLSLFSVLYVGRYGGGISQTRRVYMSFGRDGNYKEKKHEYDDLPASPQTREQEHPGPPPPNTSEISPNTGATLRSEQQVDPDVVRRAERTHQHQEQQKQQRQRQQRDFEKERAKEEVSSGARPTIRGQQVKDGMPEGVRRHNEEMARRYDRAYNQIGDEGSVSKGFWQKEEDLTGERG
ncbi:DNA-directed RNA polymerase subunit beta' [Talaromyces islandicus]|uniref:DNA-directed RNA polymerase subunit beta n=1 Tax=Talaromyces islandicus TaxID=28573 RepID=A0A0U1LUC0_TALIS|nr:DNA-directed RNA polymerase subunit beta' [Talaromyces islandicus]